MKVLTKGRLMFIKLADITNNSASECCLIRDNQIFLSECVVSNWKFSPCLITKFQHLNNAKRKRKKLKGAIETINWNSTFGQ